MSEKFSTRMGDGERVWMDSTSIREDIKDGTADAARKAGIPELTAGEQDYLFEIITDPCRMVSVKQGAEVTATDDGCTMAFYAGQDSGGGGTPLSRMQAVLTYERACGACTTNIGHSDYSIKPVKSIINFEASDYYNISMVSTAPFFYGAQPNLGLYFQPDGPCPNAAELMPLGKIDEARSSQERAAEYLEEDILFVIRRLANIGLEGFNLDTCASAGDADFLAVLRAVEKLKNEFPDLPIIVGTSGEFVLGMHGEVTYKGKRLAGMFGHDQAKIVEEAGADIFGLAVNTNSARSVQWNLARSITFLKATREACNIPVHANVGMGVCGVPLMETPPIDSVSRVSKALVEIGMLDGLQIGVGDPMGMSISHIMASCMGGIRTSGDLVAWMQMTRKMRINEAKAYVAERLGIDRIDLTNEDVMRGLREDLGIGTVVSVAGSPKGIRAKRNVAKLLDINIRSVDLFDSE